MPAAMNPQFHKNILKIYSQNGNGAAGFGPINLHRGQIINKDGSKGVRFLYNPSQVQVNHPLNAQQVPSEIAAGTGDQGTNIATDSGSLGFSLLFDRTYEVWESSKHAGVLEDVKAFYALTKISEDTQTIPDTLSPMSPEPAYFYFGQGGKTLKERALTRPLSYYGWITSLSITYTHWTHNMIPSRCAISISVNLIPNQASASDPGGPLAGTGAQGTPVAPGQGLKEQSKNPPVTLPGPGTGRSPIGDNSGFFPINPGGGFVPTR